MSLAAMHRLICPTVLALAVVCAPRPARARTVVVATQLDYDAAPGCPGAARFAAVVIGRLGYDAFSPDAQTGSSSASRPQAERWKAGSSGTTRAAV